MVLYVGLYQLYIAKGYQEFAGIESSVTTKVSNVSLKLVFLTVSVVFYIRILSCKKKPKLNADFSLDVTNISPFPVSLDLIKSISN